jgi:hypothetical protein
MLKLVSFCILFIISVTLCQVTTFTTIAGGGTRGSTTDIADYTALESNLNYVTALALNGSLLYIAITNNNYIKVMDLNDPTPRMLRRFCGTGLQQPTISSATFYGHRLQAKFKLPIPFLYDLTRDVWYVTTYSQGVLQMINGTTGNVSLIVNENGSSNVYSGDGKIVTHSLIRRWPCY